MLAAFVALAISNQAPASLTLSRGTALPDGVPYFSVADTTLDASLPNENLGGSPILAGGPNRVILLRFRDLDRAVGAGRGIREASLLLHFAGGTEAPQLRTVRTLRRSWGEGPLKPLALRLAGTTTPAVAPLGSATWRDRHAGVREGEWTAAGAGGGDDSEALAGVTGKLEGETFRIVGLGAAFERMRRNPDRNEGIALVFTNETEFLSSEADRDRPALELTTEEIAPTPGLAIVGLGFRTEGGRKAVAQVRNEGASATAATSFRWTFQGRVIGSGEFAPLAPGASRTVELNRPAGLPDPKDRRWRPLGFSVGPVDQPLAERVIEEDAVPLEGSSEAAVRTWNENVAPYSRYSFAPDGLLARVRLALPGESGARPCAPGATLREQLQQIALALGLLDGRSQQFAMNDPRLVPAVASGSSDPYPGLLGYGDTRYEGALPGRLWLPYEPVPADVLTGIRLEASGLLAATDVARLNAALEGPLPSMAALMPQTAVLRVTDRAGRSLAGLEIDFFQMQGGRVTIDVPDFSLATSPTGTLLVPNRDGGVFGALKDDLSNGVILARARLNGVTDYAWLKAWQLMDAASRGNRANAFVDLRFNLPLAPLEAGGNLALNRVVSVSDGSTDGLSALVDGDPGTRATVGGKVDGWFEIDLGRDRRVGEVRLRLDGPFWRRFDVRGYATGQTAAESAPLAKELDSRWTAANRSQKSGDSLELVYRTAGERVRYIRFVNLSGESASLREVTVVPVAAN